MLNKKKVSPNQVLSHVFSPASEWIHCERKGRWGWGKSREGVDGPHGLEQLTGSKSGECTKDNQPWVQGVEWWGVPGQQEKKNPFLKSSLNCKVSVPTWERAVPCLVWRMLLSRGREHHLVTTGLPTGQGTGKGLGTRPCSSFLFCKPWKAGNWEAQKLGSSAGGEGAFCGMQIVCIDNYFNDVALWAAGVWILGIFQVPDSSNSQCLSPGAHLHIPSRGSVSPSQSWILLFPGWSLCCALRPGAASEALGHERKRCPKHPWGQGTWGFGEQSPSSLSCWSCSPLGTFWNSLSKILHAWFLCFTIKTLIVGSFFVVRGDSTPLWADPLIFL